LGKGTKFILDLRNQSRKYNFLLFPITLISRNILLYVIERGPGVAYWLRRCATSRKVPGSIPGGVTGFFIDISLSDRSMALGST
jgi:hypothetical protein